MRVLVLAPQIPWPPRQGTALRNLHVARQLAERHDVTLVAFGLPPDQDDPLVAAGARLVAVPPPTARRNRTRVIELFSEAEPDLARRLRSPRMGAAVAAALEEIEAAGGVDVIQVEGLEMAAHGLAAIGLAAIGSRGPGARPTRLVYDAHNAEWLLQDRAWRADVRQPRRWHGALYSLLQTAKLRRFERRLLLSSDAVVAVSAADAAALWDLAEVAVTVVPNGVDVARYEPADPSLSEAGLCVFTGKMDFRPNVDAMTWFCARVWPRVLASRPDARLEIVGRDPVGRVRALAGPSVRVTGEVDDVRPYLRRASVVVAPLRVGGGTRLKVLEAMAMARPVAATSLGVEGLDLEPGRELLVADAPADLADAIETLLSDAARRVELGARARAAVASRYRWETLVPRIESLYEPLSLAYASDEPGNRA